MSPAHHFQTIEEGRHCCLKGSPAGHIISFSPLQCLFWCSTPKATLRLEFLPLQGCSKDAGPCAPQPNMNSSSSRPTAGLEGCCMLCKRSSQAHILYIEPKASRAAFPQAHLGPRSRWGGVRASLRSSSRHFSLLFGAAPKTSQQNVSLLPCRQGVCAWVIPVKANLLSSDLQILIRQMASPCWHLVLYLCRPAACLAPPPASGDLILWRSQGRRAAQQRLQQNIFWCAMPTAAVCNTSSLIFLEPRLHTVLAVAGTRHIGQSHNYHQGRSSSV